MEFLKGSCQVDGKNVCGLCLVTPWISPEMSRLIYNLVLAKEVMSVFNIFSINMVICFK